MIFPIRCFSCGSLIGNKIRLYQKKVKEKKKKNPNCSQYGDILDTLKNELVERVEEILEVSRDRDITLADTNIHGVSTSITNVEVIERELPLGEIVITVQCVYQYVKGVL